MKVAFARWRRRSRVSRSSCTPNPGCATTTGPCADRKSVDLIGREPGYRYLRARGNSIEGGTSEILRNTISERILGLPGEHRVDKDVAWKDLDR